MDSLVSEGFELLVFGMGFVFVFLTLLVLVTSLMSKLVGKFLPEPVIQPKPKAAAPAAAVSKNNDELLAVLTAAVHKYRK